MPLGRDQRSGGSTAPKATTGVTGDLTAANGGHDVSTSMRAKGAFITFEGVEGSGKTTQARRLGADLVARGLTVCLTGEPDGTPLGLAVRALLEADGVGRTPLAETFLFLAARQQHVAQVLRPALERGELVISDRYLDATTAYQGYGRGVDVQAINELNLVATGGVLPDLTLVLDLPAAAGIARIAGRTHDSFERLGPAFHERVRQGYRELAQVEQKRIVVISADRVVADVARDISRIVEERLGGFLGGA